MFFSRVAYCCFGRHEEQLSISWERMSSVSPLSSSRSSRASFVCADCSVVISSIGSVVAARVMGRIGCLSLLLTVSLSMESHFKPSCATVSQVVSFVRSLLSLSTSLGCRWVLTSPSLLFAGHPRLWYPVCLTDIAGLHFEMRHVQRSSWCLAIILACFQYTLLCLRVKGKVPLVVMKSSALWVARTLQCTLGSSSSSIVSLSFGVLLKRRDCNHHSQPPSLSRLEKISHCLSHGPCS